jgi:uncharacterized protein YjlB
MLHPGGEAGAMYVVESIKRAVGRITAVNKLAPRDLAAHLRRRKPQTTRFKDDGDIPNNPLPLVLYRSALQLADSADPAAIFEQLFAANGWGGSWRNGIYDYVHYHSRIHEVLGIARGQARVRLGGDRGNIVEVKAGDVAVLPAGTGHQCLGASDDFLVVGAYPPSGTYDECRGSPAEHARALQTIRKVALPRKDPVYGTEGPLLRLWAPSKRSRKSGTKPGTKSRPKASTKARTKARTRARPAARRPRAAKRRSATRKRAARP